MARILIIAPDSELRKSVEFALSVEGHDLTSRASIGARESPHYDCTVVDHHALGSDRVIAVRFCAIFAPVILLSSQIAHPLSEHVFRTLLKPLLGPALVSAINDALRAVPT